MKPQSGLLLIVCIVPLATLAGTQDILGTLVIGAAQGVVLGVLFVIIGPLYYWLWKPYRQKVISRKTERRVAELPEIVVMAAGGDLNGVRDCLDRGTDPNIAGPKGETALILAARNGRLEVTELLLERGADPMRATRSGSTAQDVAHTYGHGHVEQFIKRFRAE
jgi:hypothetical protein